MPVFQCRIGVASVATQIQRPSLYTHVSIKRSRRTYDFPLATPLARNIPVAIAVLPNTCTDIDSGATCCSWEGACFPDCFKLAKNYALVCIEPSSFPSTMPLSRRVSRALASPDLYAWFHAPSRATIFDLVADSDASCALAKTAITHNKTIKRPADFTLHLLRMIRDLVLRLNPKIATRGTYAHGALAVNFRKAPSASNTGRHRSRNSAPKDL